MAAMPKRFVVSNDGRTEKLAALLLGSKARVSELADLSLELLVQRTQEQLNGAARLLGLSGLSQLKKRDLARRVQAALKRRTPALPAQQSPAPASKAGATMAGTAKARAPAGGSSPKPRREPHPRAATPRRAASRRQAPKGRQEPETGARSKFDLGSRVAEPPVEQIPWGYGQNRISALAVDPRRMYAYWEVRDDAIDVARAALGSGGKDAWLNLRVYDISGRIFDGTNAHSYFDVKLERDIRQWFFEIGKPTSTHCVEVGLKSYEGYFQKVARSGRVDFPRAEPPSTGPVEWMSVHDITGEIGPPVPGVPRTPAAADHAPAAVHHSPPPAPAAHAPGAWAEGDYWVVDSSALLEQALMGGWQSQDLRLTEWIGKHGRREWLAGGLRFEWVGPVVSSTWEAGPFPMPIEAPGLVEERHEGPVLVQRIGERTRVIYGPWQVVIRGIGGRAERRVIARWEVRKSWLTQLGFEVVGDTVRWVTPAPGKGLRPGSSEGLLVGASERHWMVGSELRLAGASEIFRIGASEFRYQGGSETIFVGGSGVRARGASERRLRGASELRLRGASERLLKGASESPYAGARKRGGASERRLGGASERTARSKYPAGGRPAKGK
jgi:hypothetical protein